MPGSTKILPRGEFATWRAARAVGDYDLNTFAGSRRSRRDVGERLKDFQNAEDLQTCGCRNQLLPRPVKSFADLDEMAGDGKYRRRVVPEAAVEPVFAGCIKFRGIVNHLLHCS